MAGVPVRVLIADDQQLMVARTTAALDARDRFELVGVAPDAAVAAELAAAVRPDVALVSVRLPGGPEWVSALEAFPERERHLALHEGHLIAPNDRDRAVVSGATLAAFGLARSVGAWRDHLAAREAAGATEIAYQPAGPDIADELQRFIEMSRS